MNVFDSTYNYAFFSVNGCKIKMTAYNSSNAVIDSLILDKPTSCFTTDIKQNINNNGQINIYPNPNNGSFTIESNNSAKQTMQVYDVNDKLVLSQTINGKTIIDASALNEGVYNISIIGDTGVVNKRLVIVK